MSFAQLETLIELSGRVAQERLRSGGFALCCGRKGGSLEGGGGGTGAGERGLDHWWQPVLGVTWSPLGLPPQRAELSVLSRLLT